MILQFIKAFSFIFIAEMGDKTQILAMAFATKYKTRDVLIGIFFGSLLNHAIAILFGVAMSRILPTDVLMIVAACLFIIFGFWSLKVDSDNEPSTSKKKYSAIFTVSLAFFLGELGDKTQLTAITLSSESAYPIIVLAATVSGMIATGFIGIYLGIRLGRKIPEGIIRLAAATVFFIYGTIRLSMSIRNLSLGYIIPYIVLIVIPFVVFSYKSYHKTKQLELTLYKSTANKLQGYYSMLQESIEDICLTEEVCGICKGNKCLVGTIRNILQQAKDHKPITATLSEQTIKKQSFKTNRATLGLAMVLRAFEYDLDTTSYKALTRIRKLLEQILFDKEISVYSNTVQYLKEMALIDQEIALLVERQYKKILEES